MPTSQVNRPRKPDALLFDLGGVLIDIDFDRAFEAWEPISRLSLDEIKRTFAFDRAYQRHERGEISATDYYEHLSGVLQLENDHVAIARGWNAIYVGEIRETTAMVQTMRKQLPCYAFTNTNAAHMEAWSRMFPAVVDSFDEIFASHLIGLRKPEQRAFDHIAERIGVAHEAIVFFDDLADNVEAASAAGLQGVLVRSPQDVRRALCAFGFAV